MRQWPAETGFLRKALHRQVNSGEDVTWRNKLISSLGPAVKNTAKSRQDSKPGKPRADTQGRLGMCLHLPAQAMHKRKSTDLAEL